MPDRSADGVDFPLHRAAVEGRAGTLAALLAESGVDVDARDDGGRTAMHLAAFAGSVEAIGLLIEHRASVDALDQKQNTPLMYATLQRHTPVVQLLLEAGANPEITNAAGKDAQIVAAMVDSAPIARLLREHVLRRRGAASDTRLAAVGGHVTDMPADKTPVFTGGLFRDSAGFPNGPVDSLDAEPGLPEEMIRSMPLTTFEGWLKQIDADELNPVGLIALDRGFPLFLSWVDFTEDSAHNVMTRRGYGVSNFNRPPRARRFAGDDTLPRGRYYTVCRNSRGDDGGALIGELYAYYRVQSAGVVAIVDSADEESIQQMRDSGFWRLPPLQTPFIGVLFAPWHDAPSPIGKLFDVEPPNTLSVLLPLTIRETQIERVLDLRQPAAARWFAHYFSRLVVDVGRDGEHKWIRCCPNRPTLDSIEAMLPTLLTQEQGGGLFCQMVGSWLRDHGVNALVYPSVRNDVSVDVINDAVVDSSGWNLVDYRDASVPRFRIFYDITNYWEEKVRVGPGLGVVGDLPDRDPYMAARVDYVSEGPRAGSWRVLGIIAIKAAIMTAQREAYSRRAADSPEGDLSWVNALPIAPDVKEWTKLFVKHDYQGCIARGIQLLPTIASFEMLQMFLISLQRSGTEPAGGGWTAAEVLEQLTPQLLHHHQHDASLHRLLSVTLGLTDANRELEDETDRTERCRILYYAAARAVTRGQPDQARAYLDLCLEAPGECLEVHLALAQRTHDFAESS
jgi:hypothetical protein